MMKKYFKLSAIAAAAIFLLACNKAQKPVEFDIPYTTEFTVTTLGLTINEPIDFTTPEINTDISKRLGENKTDIQFIDEVKYTKLDIQVKLPQGQKLDFLKSIQLYINANGETEKLVAFKDPVPVGDSLIMLEMPDLNIKNYIIKNKFSLRAFIIPDATLSENVTLTVSQNVHVKAKQILK